MLDSKIRSFLIVWRHLPFLNVSYSLFQKSETLESSHNWLLNNWSFLLNLKGPRT